MVTTVTDNSPQSINTSLFSLDKEVQEIKKVTDKLAGINTESGVISVNGKQGIVELTASDVNALPSSTVIPTTTSELENTSGFITKDSDITGNAATATTAKKVANALTVNGKTYDGSSAVDAGVQTVANGGTGATDAASGFNTLADGVRDSTTPADNEKMLLKPSGTWYKTTCLDFWNYIKGKISSVLGLTKDNYGGKASTAGTADNADMVDGYHASESAQGSTVGVRDAGGYFNARIFHDDWGEENINTFSNPKIMFKETNDGYIRNTDPSNVKVGAASSADTATTAAKLGRDGNTGIPMTFNWSGQGGQPSWLWGGNDGSNMYVYNPSNFSVNRASTAGTADKAVEVVDYGHTSRTVKIGFAGPGVTANNLLCLAGYTEYTGSSIKLKDVNKEELIKWLGIPRIKYADYQTPSQTFTQFQQVPIELSEFSSEVTPNNVLCFMVIYWTGVQLIASADWGSAASSGLKCALISLGAGTGYAIIRCVYMV